MDGDDMPTNPSQKEGPEEPPSRRELEALASFRYALRRFLAFSELAAAEFDMTMQWYQALLVVKTYEGGNPISVGQLADQLMIRDHSAAELVSRLAQAKLVRRKTDPADRRRSLIIMTALGDRRLDQLANIHLRKLRESKGSFLKLFDAEDGGGAISDFGDAQDSHPALGERF